MLVYRDNKVINDRIKRFEEDKRYFDIYELK
jgi:hypothetical protein